MAIKTIQEIISKGETFDILLWVGCAGSFDERSQNISISVAKILNHFNIKFGILGQEEVCTGDVAKRAGNEFLFQMQAQANIQTFKNYNIKDVLTFCPHCLNTLKNEYNELGAELNVIHHTDYILDILKKQKANLDTKKLLEDVVFHDPCYLGRANGIYESPRQILSKYSKKVFEAPRNKKNSFCCGAGGAQVFKEAEKGNTEVNNQRAKELKNTQAETIAVGCPFCKLMIDDGIKNIKKENEKDKKVKDISEIICEALDL